MMYLIYNNDGSLKLKNLCEVIDRGDNNTKQIFVAVENRDNDTYSCIANFRLPDGTINQLTGVASTESIDSETSYPGFLITLTAAQTLYPGNVEMAIELLDLNDNVLFTFTTNLQINDTPYVANETYITVAQYNALVAAMNGYQVKFTANNVRKYSSVSALTDDLDNLAVGQVCLYKDSNDLYRIAEIVYDSDTDSNDYEEKGMYLPLLNAAALQINGYDVATKNYVDTSIGTLDTFVKANFAHSLAISLIGNTDKLRLVFNLKDYNGTSLFSVYQDIGSAGTSYAGLLSAADKVKIDNIATDIATALATAKAYTDSQVASTYKYKGTKTVAQINALTGMTTGDVYNVSDSGTLTDGNVDVVAGDNVAWNGSAWDKLAGAIDLSNYATNTYVNQLNAENVKLTGAQEIAGYKTFTADIRRKYGANGWIAFGSVPGSNVPLNILFNDGNTTKSLLRYETALNGFRFFGNLLAATDNDYNIGDSLHRYNDAWITGLLRNGTESITVKQIVDNFTDIANNKQDNLVSGTNIKTLNNESLLGSGNISYDDTLDDDSTNAVQNKVIKATIDNLNAEIVNLRAMFEETTIEEKTLSYSYLQWDAIPSNIDGQPIVFSGGSEMTNVKGNSCVVNQLYNFTTDLSASGKLVNGITLTTDFNNNRSIRYNGTNTEETKANCSLCSSANDQHNLIVGHKYLLSLCLKGTKPTTSQAILEFGGLGIYTSGNVEVKDVISTAITNTTYARIQVQVGQTVDFTVCPNLFDLTLMGLDSLTTVDEVRSALLSRGINIDEYNQYNDGSIKNSKPTSLVVHHFNLWNEQWFNGYWNANTGVKTPGGTYVGCNDYISVRPNTKYYITAGTGSYYRNILAYDKNKNFLGRFATPTTNRDFTTPNNCYFITFYFSTEYGDTYKNDVCISIFNTSLNGTYKPYQAPTEYALDLPILRSAGASNNLVQDDSKKADVSDLALNTLTFTRQASSDGTFYYFVSGSIIERKGGSTSLLCNKYAAFVGSRNSMPDKAICSYNQSSSTALVIRDDSFTDETTFMNSLASGDVVYYEKATPTDQPTITLPDDIVIENGDSFEITYDSTDNCGADFDFAVATNKLA